jgi:hypothetical protein
MELNQGLRNRIQLYGLGFLASLAFLGAFAVVAPVPIHTRNSDRAPEFWNAKLETKLETNSSVTIAALPDHRSGVH